MNCGAVFGLANLWAACRRSWAQSTAMQLATLAALISVFSVLTFALTASLNLKRILASWGESVQIVAYLQDGGDLESETSLEARVRKSLEALPEAASLEFVSREKATDIFRAQMSSYAPDLLSDKDFAHPFPASFRIKLSEASRASQDPGELEALALRIEKIAGVESASFGQGWAKNYAGLVRLAGACGWILALVLGVGALFVIGNSIRASISGRREEIEILELVGATARAIRAPYVFEGAALGFSAAALAVFGNFGLWIWGTNAVRESAALSRLGASLEFLSPAWIALILAAGAGIGALGAYLIVRAINDGWAASRSGSGGASDDGSRP